MLAKLTRFPKCVRRLEPWRRWSQFNCTSNPKAIRMSVEDVHTIVDQIVYESRRCMMTWSILSPLLFRAQRRQEKQHMLTIALHQIDVFVQEYRSSGTANEEMLIVAVEVLGGSTCRSSSGEESVVANSPIEDEIDILESPTTRLPLKKRIISRISQTTRS